MGELAGAGACSRCRLGVAAMAGGSVAAGGAVAGVTAARGLARGVGGVVVTVLATALPLVVVGLVLRRRARRS